LYDALIGKHPLLLTGVHAMLWLYSQAAYQEVQAFAKFGGAGTKSLANFNTKGSSGGCWWR
jgi:hypothetical protein